MNKITEWSYDSPTKTGLYLMCFGDVETRENIQVTDIVDEYSYDVPIDQQIKLADLPDIHGYKWARLAIGKEART